MTVWYLYIIRCRDRSLYTGIATDVGRRFGDHAGGSARCAKYLRGKGPLML
ncbi:MAG: GIY-YIG nuclease family protein, partial [Chitinispirillaceae bacterium]|nr:GIY-YIG nuclease family protein [Chitinispirillaceae bacterium]